LNGCFFADTYALFEIVDGNPEFGKYINDAEIITTSLNLMELYYGLLLKHGAEKAEAYYSVFQPRAVLFSDETIKSAMKFRLAQKGKNLSYVDCVGYQVALENNVKFLTGDRGFAGMPNVEYVK